MLTGYTSSGTYQTPLSHLRMHRRPETPASSSLRHAVPPFRPLMEKRDGRSRERGVGGDTTTSQTSGFFFFFCHFLPLCAFRSEYSLHFLPPFPFPSAPPCLPFLMSPPPSMSELAPYRTVFNTHWEWGWGRGGGHLLPSPPSPSTPAKTIGRPG